MHRDIKPSNVLLDLDNRPLLGDFGLVRSLDAANLTPTVGTPHFRAPEVVDADAGYGTAVDLFAFAMLIYNVETKNLPPLNSTRETPYEHLHFPPDNLFAELFAASSSQNPAERWSADACVAWLEAKAHDPSLAGDLERFVAYKKYLQEERRSDELTVERLLALADASPFLTAIYGGLLLRGWGEIEQDVEKGTRLLAEQGGRCDTRTIRDSTSEEYRLSLPGFNSTFTEQPRE
jgi:serine/threonine protein kinase